MTITNGERDLTTRGDVIRLYRRYLGRDPENEGAITGRLGLPVWLVEQEIATSPEARARAAEPKPVGPEGPKGPDPGDAPPPPPITFPEFDIPGADGIGDLIAGALRGSLDELGRKLDEISGGKLTDLSRELATVAQLVDASRGRITEGLSRGLIDVAIAAIGPVGVAARAMQQQGAAFIEAAANIDDVAGAFVSAVTGQKEGLLKFGLDVLTGGMASGMVGLFEKLESEAPEVQTATARRLLESPALPDHVRELLAPMLVRHRPANFILGVVFGALSLGSFANAALAQEIELTRQAAAEQFPVSIPSLAEIAAANVRGVMNDGDAQALAVRWGFDTVPYRVLREIAKTYPPYQEAISGWLRGDVDERGLDFYLGRLGYDETARALFKSLAFIVPPAQDAIRFAVREVYSQRDREELMLDADLPERFVAEARKSGIDATLARDYWAAHWELPSPLQVFEMLHRRAKKIDGTVFTQADVDRYLKTADFAPTWRPLLSQIAFTPLTRVDIRRMRKVDLLSADEVIDAHRDIGYDDKWARRLAEFVERDVKGEKKVETADLTAGLRSRIVSAVVAGTIGDERGRSWLAQLGADAEDVELLIIEAAEIRGGQRAGRIRELVEQLYVRGKWTLDEARAELARRGFTNAEISGIAEEIELERRLRGPDDAELADRDLTKAEILTARDEAILTDAQARDMLSELRYDPPEVELMIALRDYKREQKEQDAEIDTIRRRLVAGKISEETAIGELDKLGLRAEHRNRLLSKWDTELRAKSADLGWSQVGELVKRKLMPEPEANAYLRRIGYDERETILSLALWGAQGAEAAAAKATAVTKAEERVRAAVAAQARRDAADAARAAAKQRDLTTGQLVAAFKRRVMNEDQLRAELLGLGYSNAETTVIISTAKAAMPGRA